MHLETRLWWLAGVGYNKFMIMYNRCKGTYIISVSCGTFNNIAEGWDSVEGWVPSCKGGMPLVKAWAPNMGN